MGRKTILQLLHGLNTGGAEILAERLGRHLSAEHDVIFACLDTVGEIGEQLLADGYRVEHLRRGSGIDWGCAGRLASLIRNEGIDLVHAHQYTPFFYSMAARMRHANRPVVFTEHGRFLPDYPRRKRVMFNRIMLGRRDRLVAVGQGVKRALVENEGLPGERIDVVYNGIPVADFAPEGTRCAGSCWRKENGLPADGVIVVQIARLSYLKDHCTAIRTIAAVDRACKMHLVIVGEGPERSKIEQAIGECNVGDRVHLLGLQQNIPQILAGADILLLTSISEGIPLTVIEGMAAGLPIVATDVGGVAEIVEEGVHGFLCPAKDHRELAERLARLARDATLRQRLGMHGRQRAHGQFSEATMHLKYDRLIESVFAAPSRWSPLSTLIAGGR